MARSRDLRVTISGDADHLNRVLKRVDNSLDRFGKNTRAYARITSRGFHTIGAAATGGAAAVAGFAIAGKKAVDVASDINESLTKNDALFGRHAKTIDSFSKTSARSLGISRKEALNAAGTFGGLFDALNIGQKQSAGMSKRLVQLASDLASFNNASPEEALQALRSGLSGEAEPMRRFNAFLSEGRVKAEAYKSGLAATGAELTEQQKIQARYNLILKDTEAAHGDFAKTSEGLANQQRILKAGINDVAGSFGTALLPSVQKIVTAFNRDLVPALQSSATDIGRIFSRKNLSLEDKLRLSFQSVTRNMGPIVRPLLDQIGNELRRADVGEKLAKGVERGIPLLADATARAAPRAVSAFVRAFQNAGPWGKLVTAGFLAHKMGAFGAAGRGAAGLFTDALKRHMGRSVAVSAAGEAAAGSLAGGVATSAASGRGKGDLQRAGRTMGTTMGRAFRGAFLIAATVGIAAEIRDKLRDVGVKLPGGSDKGGLKGLGEDILKLITRPPNPLGPLGKLIPFGPFGDPTPEETMWGGGAQRTWRAPSTVGGSNMSRAQSLARRFRLRITSGYRSPVRNRMVGGVEGSLHTKGSPSNPGAIDMVGSMADMRAASRWAAANLPLKENLIHDAGSGLHLHLGFGGGGTSGGLLGGSGGVSGMAGVPAEFVEPIRHYGKQLDPLAQSMYGISGAALLAKLLKGESGFRMDAVSSAGARGAAQFMPGTRKAVMEKYGIDPWRSPDEAVHAAVLHLTGQLGHRKGLAGYNPGDPKYSSYILGQKIGQIPASSDEIGTYAPEVLGADDYARLAKPYIRSVVNPLRKPIAKGFANVTSLNQLLETDDRDLSRLQRFQSISEEDLSTFEGRALRKYEITNVLRAQEKRKARQQAKLREIKRLIKQYQRLRDGLKRKLKTVPSHLRPAIRAEIQRYQERIDGLRIEARILGEDIKDTQVDIAETQGELGAVDKQAIRDPTEVAAEQRADRFLGLDLMAAQARLTPGTEDDRQALITRRDAVQSMLATTPISDKQTILDLTNQLADLNEQINGFVDVTKLLADQTAALKDEMKRQNDFAVQVTSVNGREVWRALADLVSGQIVGPGGYGGRSATAGAGSVTRY